MCARIFWAESETQILLDRSQLLIHLHKIEVVPGFDDLAVPDTRDGDAGELHWQLRRGEAQAVARVSAAHAATRSYFVAFSNLIFDDDFDIGKSLAELGMKREKPLRTTLRILRIIRESVSDTIIGKHCRDRFGASLIPNFFEPTSNQCLIFI